MNSIKYGATQKNVSNRRQHLTAVLPGTTLRQDKFENLIHKMSRIENSTLEINVSLFRVLQWQPPASAPAYTHSLLMLHQTMKYLYQEELVAETVAAPLLLDKIGLHLLNTILLFPQANRI